MLTGHDREIGRFAWAMAWVGLVMGQVHALARFRTEDGRSDLDLPLTGVWARPAGDLLSPILTWADPDVVYLTYGKIWLPVFVAFTLCAFVVRRRRQPTGAEKWAWRVALTGYVLACLSAFGEFWIQWTSMNQELLDTVFLVTVPSLLLTLFGSTFLGIVLLRRGLRLPAALLTLAVPGVLVISEITSLGCVVLPIAFAFGILGHRIARADAPIAAPSGVVATT